jgi:hypothetical protein
LLVDLRTLLKGVKPKLTFFTVLVVIGAELGSKLFRSRHFSRMRWKAATDSLPTNRVLVV